MIAPAFRPLPLLLALTAIAGCAPRGGYPSLTPRPIEQISLAEPSAPAVKPPAPAAEAQAATAFAPIVARAEQGDEAFRKALAAERPALSTGHTAAVGSDGWTAAQQAFSRVDAARDPVRQALADLSAAQSDPATAADPARAAAIATAVAKVQAIDDEERTMLSALTPPAG